jgi:hypothetical protein
MTLNEFKQLFDRYGENPSGEALDSVDPVLRLYHERLARQDAAALGTATFDALLDELPAAPRPAN